MKNYSRQRKLVLDIVKESYEHPTAEEVYNSVHRVDEKISKSTVYKNLKELAEDGTILKIFTSNNECRFDYMKSKHHHAVCKKCGKIFDFEYSFNMNKVKSELQEQISFILTEKPVVVVGICNECKK